MSESITSNSTPPSGGVGTLDNGEIHPPVPQVVGPVSITPSNDQKTQSGPDLSSDAASDEVDVRVQLLQQRLSHQKWLFGFAIAFTATLAIAFLVFVFVILFCSARKLDPSILWLGSGLIVPSSAVMFILMRNIYAPLTDKPETPESKGGIEIAPAQVCLTEFASTVRELIKAGPSMLSRK
jgi:hypothetical protein